MPIRIADRQKIIEGILENPEGITLCLDGTIPAVSGGFYVSTTNNSFTTVSDDIVERVIMQIIADPLAEFIGSWYSPKTEEYFIDATACIRDKASAIETARAFSQQAIFDIARMEAVYV